MKNNTRVVIWNINTEKVLAMSLIEDQEVFTESNPKKLEKKENGVRTRSPFLFEINQIKKELSIIQKIKFNISGVVKIEEGKYLKKCHDCGDIYLTNDPNDYYCPEG